MIVNLFHEAWFAHLPFFKTFLAFIQSFQCFPWKFEYFPNCGLKAFDAFCKTEKLGIHQEIHDFLKSTEEKGNLSGQKPNLKIPIIVMWSQKERCYMINILNKEHTVAAISQWIQELECSLKCWENQQLNARTWL